MIPQAATGRSEHRLFHSDASIRVGEQRGLTLRHVSKTFPGVKALRSVALDIGPGEVHGLIGQNGSGKSTLIKILAGYHPADPGSLGSLDGDVLDLSHAGAARHPRLRFVHQDLGLFLELSAVDNLALRGGFVVGRSRRVDWAEQEHRTRRLLAEFDVDMDVTRPLGEATPIQRTIVAIAAARAGWTDGSGVLVLDEPTAVLPPADVSRLLGIVERARANGTSVLYVSHRLDEVIDVADRVTVLREGAVVAQNDVAGLTTQDLAELMVGGEVDARYRAALTVDDEQPVVLRVRGLWSQYLSDVDLDLRQGEVVGVAGLPGSGRDQIAYAIAGAIPGSSGKLQVDEQSWESVGGSSSAIALVPADRARESSVADFSVAENLSLLVLSELSKRGRLSRTSEQRLTDRWINSLTIATPSPDAAISSLSGGNQQKVIMARCLAAQPRVLLLCEPTAGVDVGSRQAIYQLIAERARAGLTMLVSSSDVGDLLAVCTRVLVMCNGRIVRELDGETMTESQLVHAMEEVGSEQW